MPTSISPQAQKNKASHVVVSGMISLSGDVPQSPSDSDAAGESKTDVIVAKAPERSFQKVKRSLAR